MNTHHANGNSRFSFWSRVREYAVPTSMIETATARRDVGDWAGACAAAGFDVDVDLKAAARVHGHELKARLRDDLRHLAPDLLRWHMPRIAPDGLLRPGLTVPLARYDVPERGGSGPRPLWLVVRTAPAWADAGQRIVLALWDGTRDDAHTARHPHPRPSRRFRLDLHRHLWDARRTGELRTRSGTGGAADAVPQELRRCAVDRWADEAAILLRAEGRPDGPVAVRVGSRRLVVGGSEASRDGALPVLPDAATWVPPDVELLRTGAIEAGRLHPLVAAALVPEYAGSAGGSRSPDRDGEPRIVDCRGARHRIALVAGVLAPLDHDPAELRREELLAALSGTPLPCLRAIDEAHRHPEGLSGVRERLDHGDTAGALAVVEGLLGPEAVLRAGALRDALETAARRRVTYGLYRAGLIERPIAPGFTRPVRPARRHPKSPSEQRGTRPRLAHRS
ncbi:hypothetical protein ACGFMM_23190 [Streptomyces sp. NPDC048604]|uniref:hypothetical protein n=1 Tax=Streptomyces sp. NPDC048604 TaxID=3365578 RepID=UPI0037226402